MKLQSAQRRRASASDVAARKRAAEEEAARALAERQAVDAANALLVAAYVEREASSKAEARRLSSRKARAAAFIQAVSRGRRDRAAVRRRGDAEIIVHAAKLERGVLKRHKGVSQVWVAVEMGNGEMLSLQTSAWPTAGVGAPAASSLSATNGSQCRSLRRRRWERISSSC